MDYLTGSGCKTSVTQERKKRPEFPVLGINNMCSCSQHWWCSHGREHVLNACTDHTVVRGPSRSLLSSALGDLALGEGGFSSALSVGN